MRLCLEVALALTALALPALAQRHTEHDGRGWVEESTGPLSGEKALEVTRFVGSVQVLSGPGAAGWTLRLHSEDPNEQNARRQFSTFHLGVSRKGNATLIQPVGPIDLSLRTELIVRIPGAEAVHVDAMGGKITVHGKVPRLELLTHAGDIELDDADQLRAVTVGGSVTVNRRLVDSYIRTDGGDIRVDASIGDLEIFSPAGNIWLKAIARGRVQSGGGNIEVVHCVGELLARTKGGNISLGEMDGAVTAESGGGSIRIGVARRTVLVSTAMGDIELWKLWQGASAHTGMGRITAEFVGNGSNMHDSELVTTMGDIVAYFSPSAPATVRAISGASPSKRILSDFADLKMVYGLPDFGPRSVGASGPIHGGGAHVELRTMAGQIELRETH
jgi:hypothetical protein